MSSTKPTRTATPPPQVVAPDEPLGAVVHRLTQQIPELVRSEPGLAQAELGPWRPWRRWSG